MRRTVTTMMTLALAAVWCAGCEERGQATDTAVAGERPAAAPSAAPAATTKLVPLGISLPSPMFKCTPRPLPNVPNLEVRERWWHKRPPFLVPPGTVNMAIGKPVTSSDPEPIIGELCLINDGDKDGQDGCYVELGPGKQWVQIDLGTETSVYAIVLWHYHQQITVYHDVVVQISKDPDFIDVVTVFNNDHDNTSGFGIGPDKAYLDTYLGKLIDCKGFSGRYVRLWSNENCDNESNQYIEVEVHGRPVYAPPTPIEQPMDDLDIETPRPMFH